MEFSPCPFTIPIPIPCHASIAVLASCFSFFFRFLSPWYLCHFARTTVALPCPSQYFSSLFGVNFPATYAQREMPPARTSISQPRGGWVCVGCCALMMPQGGICRLGGKCICFCICICIWFCIGIGIGILQQLSAAFPIRSDRPAKITLWKLLYALAKWVAIF